MTPAEEPEDKHGRVSRIDHIGFKIDRATYSGFTVGLITTTAGVNATSYSATGLSANTTYYFRVRAYNTGGVSAYSNTDWARTKR